MTQNKTKYTSLITKSNILLQKGLETKYGIIEYITWDEIEGYICVIKNGDSYTMIPTSSIVKSDIIKTYAIQKYGTKPD